jgi:hypothetical protein
VKKLILFLGSTTGIAVLSGCAAANVFAIANNVTGTIVNVGVLAGAFGVAANIEAITEFLQQLVGGV